MCTVSFVNDTSLKKSSSKRKREIMRHYRPCVINVRVPSTIRRDPNQALDLRSGHDEIADIINGAYYSSQRSCEALQVKGPREHSPSRSNMHNILSGAYAQSGYIAEEGSRRGKGTRWVRPAAAHTDPISIPRPSSSQTDATTSTADLREGQPPSTPIAVVAKGACPQLVDAAAAGPPATSTARQQRPNDVDRPRYGHARREGFVACPRFKPPPPPSENSGERGEAVYVPRRYQSNPHDNRHMMPF